MFPCGVLLAKFNHALQGYFTRIYFLWPVRHRSIIRQHWLSRYLRSIKSDACSHSFLIENTYSRFVQRWPLWICQTPMVNWGMLFKSERKYEFNRLSSWQNDISSMFSWIKLCTFWFKLKWILWSSANSHHWFTNGFMPNTRQAITWTTDIQPTVAPILPQTSTSQSKYRETCL